MPPTTTEVIDLKVGDRLVYREGACDFFLATVEVVYEDGSFVVLWDWDGGMECIEGVGPRWRRIK